MKAAGPVGVHRASGGRGGAVTGTGAGGFYLDSGGKLQAFVVSVT